jgi:hypothetical protein
MATKGIASVKGNFLMNVRQMSQLQKLAHLNFIALESNTFASVIIMNLLLTLFKNNSSKKNTFVVIDVYFVH